RLALGDLTRQLVDPRQAQVPDRRLIQLTLVYSPHHELPSLPAMVVAPNDELPHGRDGVDEWLFAAWAADGSVGLLSGHRLTPTGAWYWSAFVARGQPLLHLIEWDVTVRSDPFVVKAPEMWAEHHCVAPLEQWSVGNEAYFVALDDPGAALDRA